MDKISCVYQCQMDVAKNPAAALKHYLKKWPGYRDPAITAPWSRNFVHRTHCQRPIRVCFWKPSIKLSTLDFLSISHHHQLWLGNLLQLLQLTDVLNRRNELQRMFIVAPAYYWFTIKGQCSLRAMPYFGWYKQHRALRLAPYWDLWPVNTLFITVCAPG